MRRSMRRSMGRSMGRSTKITKRKTKRSPKRKTKRSTERKTEKTKKTKRKIISEFDDPINKKIINKLIHKTTLKKGTILYKTQPTKCKLLKRMKCGDTDKMGVYLSKNIYTPLGMILEYNKPMYLCKYKLNKNIEFYNGKYSYRYLEPKRFFKTMEDLLNYETTADGFIRNVNPKISTNHIQGGVKGGGGEDYLYPISELFGPLYDTKGGEKIWSELDEAEVFLTDPEYVECVSEEFIEVSEAKKRVQKLVDKVSKSNRGLWPF